jgi:hypothetical protein
MLHANDVGEECSGAVGFSLWRNWDFGVFTVKVSTQAAAVMCRDFGAFDVKLGDWVL